MTVYLNDIESWWRHLGCWDREQASGIPYEDFDGEAGLYLESTDDWWYGLDTVEKFEVYEAYFDEC